MTEGKGSANEERSREEQLVHGGEMEISGDEEGEVIEPVAGR